VSTSGSTAAPHQARRVATAGDRPDRALAGRGRRWAAPTAGLLAGLVALLYSWHPSLWSDEAATISAARRPVPELWDMLGTVDLVHGSYYLFMHGWTDLFGTSAFSLRLPSAIAVGVAAACVHGLGARLRGPDLALWGVVVFAATPRLFWAGTEGRPYAMTAMFAAAATLVLLVALDTGRTAAWVGYAALLVLGVLSNLYLGLLIAAHLVSILWDRRVTPAQRLRWAVSAGAATVLCAPFLAVAYGQSGQLGDRALSLPHLVQNVVVNQWFLGDTPTATTGSGRTPVRAGDIGSWWVPASLLLAATCWALVGYALVRHRSTLSGAGGGRRPVLVWLLPWTVLPTAVIGLYSLVVTPMYEPRYLTFVAPAVALLVATGLTALPRRSLRYAAAGLIVLAALPVYVSQRQLYAKNTSDWVSVAALVGDRAEPGDGVYFAPRYDVNRPTVGQTTRGIQVAYPDGFAGLVDLTELRTPVEADDLVGESRYLRQSGARLAAVDTVWVVRRADYPASDAAEDEGFLAAQGFRRAEEWRGPLDVVLRFERATAP
jgi:mannosyltransferase